MAADACNLWDAPSSAPESGRIVGCLDYDELVLVLGTDGDDVLVASTRGLVGWALARSQLATISTSRRRRLRHV